MCPLLSLLWNFFFWVAIIFFIGSTRSPPPPLPFHFHCENEFRALDRQRLSAPKPMYPGSLFTCNECDKYVTEKDCPLSSCHICSFGICQQCFATLAKNPASICGIWKASDPVNSVVCSKCVARERPVRQCENCKKQYVCTKCFNGKTLCGFCQYKVEQKLDKNEKKEDEKEERSAGV